MSTHMAGPLSPWYAPSLRWGYPPGSSTGLRLATMATYGSWPTPVTSELVVRAAAGLGDVRLLGDTVVWSELRPGEGGRTQLVRRVGDGPAVDLLPAGVNARTAVHEYGGGAWWLTGDTVWFTDWADQRLYRLTG